MKKGSVKDEGDEMKKMDIVIADSDEQYLEHLARYFMEKAEQCEIYTFSSKVSLEKYMSVHKHIDILLLDYGMLGIELNHVDVSVKMVLLAGEAVPDEYVPIKKYQKTEDILKEVFLKYADQTGDLNAIKGNRKTKIIAFYSPIGGSGKTTLALNTASACARAGLHTFYLNMERIDSASSILPSTAGSYSDIFLALKSKGADVGVKIITCKGKEVHTGFDYISSPDSISEYGEISLQEWERLLDVFLNLEKYDVLLLDFGSEFYPDKAELLKKSDVIFVPILSDEFSINRMRLFLHEDELHQEYHSIVKKMKLIVNKADASGIDPALRNSGILQTCPLTTVITTSPVFMAQQNLLRSAEYVKSVFDPIVDCIKGEMHG